MCRGLLYRISTDDLSRDGSTLCGITDCKDMCKAANVFFRDIQYIYNAITVAWMYVTPMFYPIDLLPDWLRKLVEYCNPMYYYIQFFRDLVLYRHFTTPRIFVGCWVMAFIMLTIGLGVFKKTQDNFILYI